MEQVAARYAGALLSLSQSDEEARCDGEVLQQFAAMLEESGELREFVESPVLPGEAKKSVLKELAPPEATKNVMNCLFLMVDKNRANLLAQVSSSFWQQWRQRSNMVLVKVRSAEALRGEEIERIREQFKARYSAQEVLVQTELCPQLMGGMQIQVGDRLLDQSLAGRLQGLRQAIAQQLKNNGTVHSDAVPDDRK